MKESLSFDDVLLVPQYSDIRSRTAVDLTSRLSEGLEFDLPVISSPMDTVTESEMATFMATYGGFGILHRYNTIQEQLDLVRGSDGIVGAAIGVTGDYQERAHALVDSGVKILCLDIAHGHHVLMRDALSALRESLGDDIHLMAGNVATLEGVNDLARWGANSARLSVGGGCFVPGTVVGTVDGPKPIEDIQVGDEVYTHTGKTQRVVDTLLFERDEEIFVIDGIECTGNHEFYVVEKKDHSVITETNIHEYAKWIEARNIEKDKHLVIELV